MLCMGRYLTAVLCVTVALCRATTFTGDQMVPRRRVPEDAFRSPHSERRRPVRVPVRSPTDPASSNFPLPNRSSGFGDIDSSYPYTWLSPNRERNPTSGSYNDGENVNAQDGTLTGPRRSDLNDISAPELESVEQMSISTLKAMSKAKTIEDFGRMMGISLPREVRVPRIMASRPPSFAAWQLDDLPPPMSARSGDPDNVMDNPVSANCEPELRPIKLKTEPELNVVYFPTCVRLPRCGGCCSSHLLTCRPTEVKPIKIKILRIEIGEPSGRSAQPVFDEGRSRRRRPRPENSRGRRQTAPSFVMMEDEEHTQCECQCRVQEQDCNPLTHDYLHSDCQCACNNRDERSKCEAKGLTHFWDDEDCMCYCHTSSSCSTGHYYDHETCSCSTVQGRSSADGAGRPPADFLGTWLAGSQLPDVYDPNWAATANGGAQWLPRDYIGFTNAMNG